MRRLPPLPFVLLIVFALVGWRPAAPPPPIVKGLAQLNWTAAGIADRAALDVDSWFAWGMGACANLTTRPACVPMNRNWDLAVQTYCPEMMLLGNEPTNLEPAGHPITPTLAASVTVSIEAICPNTLLVAGNIHLNNWVTSGGDWNREAAIAEAYTWLADYLAAYKLKSGHAYGHALGVHCYGQYATECVARLSALTALPFVGHYWLTEFGIYGESPYVDSGAELGRFLAALPLALPGRIDRAYIWTNRTDPRCCSGWPFELVNGNGTLTPMGVVWANWQPPTVRQVYVPLTGDVMAGGAYP